MNKAESAAELTRSIPEPSALDFTLRLSTEEEFLFYQQLLRQPYVQNNEITPGTYLHFSERGVLFTFFDEDKLYLVIPEEVKEAIRELDWDAVLRTRSSEQMVLKYVDAAVNLYGVCTPEQLLNIYNDQNGQSLTMAELEEITHFHLNRMQLYERIDGYFASHYFDSDSIHELQGLLKRIRNKPLYIPGKEEFLKHSENHYYEKTPQLLQLRLFILNQLCNNAKLVDELLDDIQLACSMEAPLQEIVNELERRDIIFDNMEQVKRFASLVTEVYNHTRLWSNCGHTPAELGALSGGHATRVIPGQRIAPDKVGRNDPCPCGSGKKFKKCCGN